MILNEEIIQLASSYLRELYSGDIGDVVWQPLQEDALLKFAQKIYQMGYDDGCYETSYSTGYTGLFGEPQ